MIDVREKLTLYFLTCNGARGKRGGSVFFATFTVYWHEREGVFIATSRVLARECCGCSVSTHIKISLEGNFERLRLLIMLSLAVEF